MPNFLSYANRLRQYVPALSPEQAQDYINVAWRDIRDSDDEWSFLHRTEYWLAPALITLNAGVTQYSDTVDLTASAVRQLAGLNNPALTQRQIRFSPNGGPVYSIAATDTQQVTDGAINAGSSTLTCPISAPFDPSMVGFHLTIESGGIYLESSITAYVSPTEVTLADTAPATIASDGIVSFGLTLTLDRLFLEETNPSASATVFRSYYSPLHEWTRMDSIYDPVLGYEFGWEIGSAEDLNRIDSSRAAVGSPYRVYFREYKANLPVYELWPTPRAQRAYTVQYWARGEDFVEDDDSLPPQIPEELLMLRARLLAYEWAMTNEPDARKVAAIARMVQQVETRYSTFGQPGAKLGLLQQVKRKDHSVYRKAFIRRGRRIGYPIDSNYLRQTDWGPNSLVWGS